jgi:hypothetical protein
MFCVKGYHNQWCESLTINVLLIKFLFARLTTGNPNLALYKKKTQQSLDEPRRNNNHQFAELMIYPTIIVRYDFDEFIL